jgi:hypothetical protein
VRRRLGSGEDVCEKEIRVWEETVRRRLEKIKEVCEAGISIRAGGL